MVRSGEAEGCGTAHPARRDVIPLKAVFTTTTLQLAVSVTLGSQQEAVQRLFPAHPTGYVTDVAGIVDPSAEAAIESLIRRLKALTGAEIAVVTLPTIGDRDEAQVALAIGRTWGVGARAGIGDPKRNAGLVLLVVPRQNHVAGTGRVRIEVGQGLEGVVTDATAGGVRRDVMGPLLGQERYGAALLAGVQTLSGIIARAYGVTDSALLASPPYRPRESTERAPWFVWAALALVVIGFVWHRLQLVLALGYIPVGKSGGWGAEGGWGGGSSGGGSDSDSFGGGGGFSGGGSGGGF